jgi:hypothetical protein
MSNTITAWPQQVPWPSTQRCLGETAQLLYVITVATHDQTPETLHPEMEVHAAIKEPIVKRARKRRDDSTNASCVDSLFTLMWLHSSTWQVATPTSMCLMLSGRCAAHPALGKGWGWCRRSLCRTLLLCLRRLQTRVQGTLATGFAETSSHFQGGWRLWVPVDVSRNRSGAGTVVSDQSCPAAVGSLK